MRILDKRALILKVRALSRIISVFRVAPIGARDDQV